VPIVLKSGSLKLLETSGAVQACNGIALPLICYLGYPVVATRQIHLFVKNAVPNTTKYTLSKRRFLFSFEFSKTLGTKWLSKLKYKVVIT
jgi:hypothetical protein